LDAKGYQSFILAAADKATAQNIKRLAHLRSLVSTSMDPAVSGGSLFDISSVSNAGQSVSHDTSGSGVGVLEMSGVEWHVWKVASRLVEADPALDDDNEALRKALEKEFPLRSVRRKRSSFLTMTPDV
jgi:hypothetical protein